MKLLDWMISLLFPRRATCMGCGSMLGCDRDDLCEDCRTQLAKSWIGVRMPKKQFQLAGAAYAYRYHGAAGGMVRNLKYNSAWVLAEEMGRDVAKAAELLRIFEPWAVTAVPMHPKRLRRRGRNHSELIARAAAARLGIPYMDILERTRNAPQQARLETAARKRNLENGFAVRAGLREEIRGRTILLIDDVWTTGATAASCTWALRAAGAGKVYFAAYANGEKKHGKNNQREKPDGTAAA